MLAALWMHILRWLERATFHFLALKLSNNPVRSPQKSPKFTLPGKMMIAHSPGCVTQLLHYLDGTGSRSLCYNRDCVVDSGNLRRDVEEEIIVYWDVQSFNIGGNKLEIARADVCEQGCDARRDQGNSNVVRQHIEL